MTSIVPARPPRAAALASAVPCDRRVVDPRIVTLGPMTHGALEAVFARLIPERLRLTAEERRGLPADAELAAALTPGHGFVRAMQPGHSSITAGGPFRWRRS